MFFGMSKRVNMCLMYVSSPTPNCTTLCAYGSAVCYFGCFGCGDEFGFLYSYVWLCCVYELSSSYLFVMPLMFTCSMDTPVVRGVLIDTFIVKNKLDGTTLSKASSKDIRL